MFLIAIALVSTQVKDQVANEFVPMMKSVAPASSEIPGFVEFRSSRPPVLTDGLSKSGLIEAEWEYKKSADNGWNDSLRIQLCVEPDRAASRREFAALKVVLQSHPDAHSFTGKYVGDLVSTHEGRQGLAIWAVRDRFYVDAYVTFQLIKGDTPKQMKAKMDQRKAMMDSLVANVFKRAMAIKWPLLPTNSKSIHP